MPDAERTTSPDTRPKTVWFLLLAVGAFLMMMAMWGMQRRSEALETLRGTQQMLGAREAAQPGDEVLTQIRREARAELVAAFEQRVPKYGLQEMGLFVGGLGMFIAGLVGAARTGRAGGDAREDDDDDASAPPG